MEESVDVEEYDTERRQNGDVSDWSEVGRKLIWRSVSVKGQKEA